MNKNEETAIVRKYFCYFMLLWIALAALYSQKADAAERYWRSSVTVTYEDPRILPLLEYAIWSVSERAQHPVYLGPQMYSAERGAIHVRIVPDAWIAKERGKSGVLAFVRPYVLASDNSVMSRAEMFIGENSLPLACAQRLVVHELIHAMGVSGHSADEHDVMYADMFYCFRERYTLSRGDISMLDAAGYDADHCWTEMNKRGDLYAPAVGGFSAELKLRDGYFEIGEETGGGYCGGTIENGAVVTLNDIRSFAGERYLGSLLYDGERLTVRDVESVRSVKMMALEMERVGGDDIRMGDLE